MAVIYNFKTLKYVCKLKGKRSDQQIFMVGYS